MTQETLLDPTWPCPTCRGAGKTLDPETGQERRCRTCDGQGRVTWDPSDETEFGF